MKFTAPRLSVRTRLAHLSPRAGLLLLVALLLLVGAGLAMAPTGMPGGSPAGGDAALYRQIAARVAHGQPYHVAAAIEQRASGFPLKPFTAVRQPLLAEIAAVTGPRGADWLLRLFALCAAAGTAFRLARHLPMPFREGAILLSATAAVAAVQSGMWVWHEMWAGVLVALALACRTRRRWAASIGLGLTAALIREFALPFLVIMAAMAWTDGSHREAKAWTAAAGVAVGLLIVHIMQVWAIAGPDDVVSPGWLRFGGWRFDLAIARESTLLIALPGWAAALLTPLALLGWYGWPGAYAARVAAILGFWMTAFLFVGRPDNDYWGFLLAPLLTIGLALAPFALRDLLAGATRARVLPGPIKGQLLPARSRLRSSSN